jgi:glycosyltransferase involved in cell wall biosynthesis
VVGRLSPEKGHITLLLAFRLLLDSGVAAKLEIIGAGPFERQIREQTAALNLSNYVLFTGELTPAKVRRRLEAADIFCMPSYSEGLPMSIMEAMAVGVPVVTTWISGIPELAVDGVTALTVPPGNSERLTEALRRILDDAPLREQLVANAREAVERQHSIRHNVAGLAAIFAT